MRQTPARHSARRRHPCGAGDGAPLPAAGAGLGTFDLQRGAAVTGTQHGNDAFAGRRLPTWELVDKLAGALNSDPDDVRERWVKARGRPAAASAVADWLTSVRTEFMA
ncbi:hypothetical protein [Streptomyces sp. NPDC051909]|uniref:hypothetical protein n=1 Tax=Streptomyces sp. NPDC051909 TaxID=3154944 RepID=UPI00343C1CD5